MKRSSSLRLRGRLRHGPDRFCVQAAIGQRSLSTARAVRRRFPRFRDTVRCIGYRLPQPGSQRRMPCYNQFTESFPSSNWRIWWSPRRSSRAVEMTTSRPALEAEQHYYNATLEAGRSGLQRIIVDALLDSLLNMPYKYRDRVGCFSHATSGELA